MRRIFAVLAIAALFSSCAGNTSRQRTIPKTEVKLKLAAGRPVTRAALDEIRLADGVTARVAWGKGVLAEFVTMEKGAVYPEQQLNEELITIVREGAAACALNGREMDLPKGSVLYLTPGMKRRLQAGPDGAKLFEVFSPVRIDHLNLAGAGMARDARVGFPPQHPTPSLAPGKVYSLDDIQLSPLNPPDPSLTYPRSGANSRLIWGRNALVSVLRMDPNSRFPLHRHPEDQLMFTTRGALEQTLIDTPHKFTGEEGHAVLMPGGMVHGAKLSEFGSDAIDIFWPVRPDYVEFAARQNALYAQVIAPGARPVRVLDGPHFAKGHARDAKGGFYVTDPKQVRYVAPDGAAKVVVPAGEYAMPGGVELSPDSKTLYVNNAGLQPGENFIWAYDVQNDGSLRNKRKFAMLNLAPEVLSAVKPEDRYDSRAGGMAVDRDGRLYVATLMGVQIFDRTGLYAGTISLPEFPLSCTFGGSNYDTLYMVSQSAVWSIPTKVRGFRN